jgi:hypothetical protein
MDIADRFEIKGRIPKGRSYQWVAAAIEGEPSTTRHMDLMLERGWTPVPAKRHPKMCRRGRRIFVDDQILMERPTSASLAARERELADARFMHNNHPASGGAWRMLVQGEPVAQGHQPQTVEITISLRLPGRLVDAAAVCAIESQEYARRMLLLILRGDLTGILMPSDDRDGWEVRHLTTEKHQ